MKRELEDLLVSKYPLLYRSTKYFECSDGWFDLLDELSAKVEKEIEKQQPDDNWPCCASQVKEKFGSLRFYMSTTTDDIEKLITEAECESCVTCEQCGKPGVMRGGGWVRVACDECEAEWLKRRNNAH